MAALDYLAAHGFSACLSGDQLLVSPASQLTEDVRQYIKAHRLELIWDLAANDTPAQALEWLGSVAHLLGCSADYLLAQGFIDRYDMAELCQAPPHLAADLVTSDPHWQVPPKKLENTQTASRHYVPQHVHHSAATASPEWIAARDAFHAHALGQCPACHPPTGRYCPTGERLMGSYLSETE